MTPFQVVRTPSPRSFSGVSGHLNAYFGNCAARPVPIPARFLEKKFPMKPIRRFLILAGILFLAASLSAQQSAAAPKSADTSNGRQPPNHADLTAIKHIVFIVKENRTFDNYFGTYPGANGATTGTLSTGQVIPLGQQPDLSYPWDINHGWGSALEGMDGGKMDRFDLNEGATVNGNLLAYTQVTQANIPNYFTYAQNFVLADNMFSSIEASKPLKTQCATGA